MSLQVENLEHNMAKVTIEVEAAKLDDAIKNATKALNDSQESGEPNPSTQVHELVKKLRNIKVKS